MLPFVIFDLIVKLYKSLFFISTLSDDEINQIRVRKKKELLKAHTMTTSNDAPDAPIHLDRKNFVSTLENTSNLIVVDFWAAWCGPCRMLAPTIEALAKKFQGTVVFGKVNTDENQAISMQFGIRGIPTLIFFKGGKEVQRVVGALPRPEIERVINSIISS